MHSVMAVTESCFLLGGLLRTTKAAGSGDSSKFILVAIPCVAMMVTVVAVMIAVSVVVVAVAIRCVAVTGVHRRGRGLGRCGTR